MTQSTPVRPNVAGGVGKALLDLPIEGMIANLGKAIAVAQMALDMNSLRTAQFMSGSVVELDDFGSTKTTDTRVFFDGDRLSLMELGFTPSFYQFTETTIELKISISMSSADEQAGFSLDVKSEAEVSGKLGFLSASVSAKLNVSTVGASYASKFNYSADAASVLRTRLVPVPVPAILEERIRKSLDAKTAERAG